MLPRPRSRVRRLFNTCAKRPLGQGGSQLFNSFGESFQNERPKHGNPGVEVASSQAVDVLYLGGFCELLIIGIGPARHLVIEAGLVFLGIIEVTRVARPRNP